MKAIFERATGRLRSLATSVPETLPAALDVVDVPDSDDGLMWDATTRAMVPRPAKVLIDSARDRLRGLQDDSRFTSFNAAQRARILALLADHFGDVRFR